MLLAGQLLLESAASPGHCQLVPGGLRLDGDTIAELIVGELPRHYQLGGPECLIAPGFIDTEMTRWLQDDPEALAAAMDRVPLHRVGSPEEVVGVLLFLLSDSSRYVTGHSIAVDGGSRHV